MKEKRKTRLDKGTSSEFIGFNAFAASSSPSVAATPTAGATAASPSGGDRSATASWTPVYTGSDALVQKAFSWLTSKRDPTTHVKALQSLMDHVAQTDVPKKQQIQAVQHFVWLYHRKIYFDPMPSVRAAALQLWIRIRERLPKAFGNLVETNAAATSSTDATVVLGMLYSTMVDSASEVQQLYNDAQNKQILFEGLYDDDSSSASPSTVDWEGGILNYAQYILSCGRHSVFYERLLQGKKSTQMAPYSELSEEQKENVLETYLRVMGIALDSLVLYLRQHPTGKLNNIESHDKIVWYKTMSNPHANLRQRTYALIATVASRSPDMTVPDLTQSLSSEKEPANWPALLECLLAVTHASKGKLASAYVQPITKAWKKSLYGANMAAAGPMLLPLTALMSRPSEVWKVLQSAWEGKDLTLGGADQWRLLQALAESLSFSLLRKQTDEDLLAEYSHEWPELYGSILLEVFSTDPSKLSGTNSRALNEFLPNIGQQLPRLEAALCRPEGTSALVYLVQKNSAATTAAAILPLLEKEEIVPLSSRAVSELLRHSENILSDDFSPFLPIFRKLFENRCPRKASGDVPSQADYEALEMILDRLHCRRLFGTDGAVTMEKFVFNDLLRWAIIHTTSLSVGQSQIHFFVAADFRILNKCLGSLESVDEKRKLWEPFLREILSAKCRVPWLTTALKTLIKHSEGQDLSWISSKTLDDFVENIERQTEASVDDSASEDSAEESEYESHLMDFLALSCGISAESNRRFVSSEVMKFLAKEICESEYAYGSRPSPIERTLLNIVKLNRYEMVDEREQDTLLLHAWAQGSSLLQKALMDCLHERPELATRFIAEASKRLKQDLKAFIGRKDVKTVEINIWATRASDFIKLCPLAEEESSLSLVGLSDKTLWTTETNLMYRLCMALFGHISDQSERYALLSNSSDVSTTDLLVSVLLSLSDASTDLAKAGPASRREDRCATFLSCIGGSEMDTGVVELCVREAVQKLETLCKTDITAVGTCCRYVAVISQLVGVLFREVGSRLSPGSDLAAESIKASENLWYIPDASKPDERIPVVIVKAHYDAEAGYYFTISFSKEGTLQERQTVIARLRKYQTDTDEIPKEEASRRSELRDVLLRRIVLEYYFTASWTSCIAELVSVLVCQIGVGDERGLGTSHYDVFQLLKKDFDALLAALDEANSDKFESAAWRLSMALGFGVSVPSHAHLLSAFKLDYTSILQKVASDFDAIGPTSSASSSVLALFSTFLHGVDGLSFETASFISKATEPKLQLSCFQGFTSDAVLALRVFNETALLAADDNSSTFHQALSYLIRGFASSWEETSESGESPAWVSHIERTLNITQEKRLLLPILSTAASESAEELTPCLYSKEKRHIAFQLLEIASDRKVPFRDECNIALPKSTELLVENWTQELTSEEADELVQDVEVVSQWLPLKMMTEIEQWKEETFEFLDEDESIGRFLVWLAVLNVIDRVAPLDFRNRPAFVSFLQKAESSNSILNRAILFEPYVNDPKASNSTPDIEQSASSLGSLDNSVGKLSSMILFRTAEVLPSLTRQWWEVECPKVYTSPVQTFVEKHIAPVILQRELKRVKSSPESFGDMTVSGSPTTRQVAAQYMQDDFMLKVLIQLPPSFPLRSAQVDCSKTLGVPQTRWKRWSLQITQMLNNQGGTLQDALLLWKDNVDKEFEGVEPCPVCYSVLHVKTHKLPALECNTCHNRFHTDCLNQWFRSSGKSQCVLCQQDWRGSRVA